MILRTRPNWARLDVIDAGTLAFSFPYNPAMVAELKQALRGNARWDGSRKCWLVDPAYAEMCADMARVHLGVQVAVPTLPAATSAAVVARVVLLEYIGRAKPDLSGDAWATGYADGAWSLRFPESVLRAWFEAMPDDTPPGAATTLYGVLGLRQTSTVDEIRAAYRRLARQWHTDVNHDPDAQEMIRRLNDAKEVLTDDLKRRRYDAGLALEAQTYAQLSRRDRNTQKWSAFASAQADRGMGYRSPLTCGYLAVEGTPKLGQFIVSKITAWADIQDTNGKIMTSFWNRDEKRHEIAWVDF